MQHVRKNGRHLVRAFASGVANGLSAPMMLITGELTVTSSHKKDSNLHEAWRDVGRFIGTSAEEYRRKKPGKRHLG